jgi:hypothetical protein
MRVLIIVAIAMVGIATWACGSSRSQPTPARIDAPGRTNTPRPTVPLPSTNTPALTSTPVPTYTPVPTDTAVPTDAPLYTLSAGAVEDPAEHGLFYEPKSDKKIIAVEFIIVNVAGEPLDINPLHGTLVDTEGFSYRPELAGYAGGQIDMVTLNPGEKVAGWVAFETPSSAKAAYIKYDVSPYPLVTIQSAQIP